MRLGDARIKKNVMKTEEAAFNKLRYDMDLMQPFCFDQKVNILHFEVVTSVYVCK